MPDATDALLRFRRLKRYSCKIWRVSLQNLFAQPCCQVCTGPPFFTALRPHAQRILLDPQSVKARGPPFECAVKASSLDHKVPIAMLSVLFAAVYPRALAGMQY